MPTMRPHGTARAHEDRRWPGPSHTYVSWKTSLVGLEDCVSSKKTESGRAHTPSLREGSLGLLGSSNDCCRELFTAK